MSTILELQKKGYDLTKQEVKIFEKKIAIEYKIALDNMRDNTIKVYSKVLDGVPKDQWLFTINKSDRLNKLKKYNKKVYDAMTKVVDKAITEGGELAFTNNYYRQQYSDNYMLEDPFFADVNKNQVEASVLGNLNRKQDIPFVPKYGKILDTLKTNRAAVTAKLDSIITQGIIQGKGANVVGKEMKDLLGISARHAQTIVRTETQRNMNSGNYSNSLALQADGIDIKRQILATLDDRTRQQSSIVDGRFEVVGKGFLYPDGNHYLIPGNTGIAKWDINDRETVADIVPGFDIESRSARNPLTGESSIISFATYPDWIKKHGLKYNKNGLLVKA